MVRMDLTVTVEVDVAVLYDTEEIVEGVSVMFSSLFMY